MTRVRTALVHSAAGPVRVDTCVAVLARERLAGRP